MLKSKKNREMVETFNIWDYVMLAGEFLLVFKVLILLGIVLGRS